MNYSWYFGGKGQKEFPLPTFKNNRKEELQKNLISISDKIGFVVFLNSKTNNCIDSKFKT